MKSRALLLWLGLAILSCPLCLTAGTREDLSRLDQRVASLEQRLSLLERSLRNLEEGLESLSARLDAVGRASQTADLRADFDQFRRQLETLSAEVDSLKASGPPAPQEVEAIPVEPASPPSAGGSSEPQGGVDPGLYDRAYHDCLQGRYELAETQFRQFLAAFPDDPRAGNSQYWIGECLYARERYPDALDAFRAVPEKYPNSSKVRAAQLKMGLVHLAMGDRARAEAALRALIEEAPLSDEAQIARERLASLNRR